ncbi:MAG: ABC transporter permease [Proteobacteria bacterium]|nr:ABC transporter permease [Pseudomonadota bacterium]
MGAHSTQLDRPADLVIPIAVLVRQRVALRQFLVRAISRRYRMSSLGFLWTMVIPLATLAIYAFVFGVVMPSSNGDGDTTAFTLRLFAGLIVFWLMAEVITQSPASVVEQTNLVKKSVFPLEVIPAVVVGTALFHSLISTLVLIAALLVLGAGIHPTILLFPIVILPLALLLTGLAWLLAGIGVYFRDLMHIVGLLMTGALFLSPVFYPIERLTPGLQTALMFNPISFIVGEARGVLLEGRAPDWAGLAIYFAIAWIIAAVGLAFFRRARKNFADVL